MPVGQKLFQQLPKGHTIEGKQKFHSRWPIYILGQNSASINEF